MNKFNILFFNLLQTSNSNILKVALLFKENSQQVISKRKI